MGYDMKFQVDVTGDSPSDEELAAWLQDNSSYMENMEGTAQAALDGETVTSWYDWQADMARASAQWPTAIIQVTYEGEDFPDHVVAYFQNGKGYSEERATTFDASQLHEVQTTLK